MQYSVKAGDTLWRIAGTQYGDPEQWRRIAEDNDLRAPDRLWVGQQLVLRESLLQRATPNGTSRQVLHPALSAPPHLSAIEHKPSMVPGRAFFYVLADEVNPLREKVVRKVMTSEKMARELSEQLGKPIKTVPNPERFGFHPTDPLSKLPPGRHALGMKPSPYSSASSDAFGAVRIKGSRFWIDVEKAQQAGATFHDAEEILADLDRIAKKSADTRTLAKIAEVRKFVTADSEVLAKGVIPPSAIKGAASMGLTRAMQGVQIIGFAMTAADLYSAGTRSVEQHSVKPIEAESVRQGGSWAMAWAGARLGAMGSAALGVETGPFDLLIGLAGGIAGGVAGYYGFGWVADHIDKQ